MMGLIFISVVLLYVLLSVAVTVWAAKWAKKHKRRPWLWCLFAMLLMYLLVAWEQIPTYLVGQYYCAKSGVTVYKTPEQWVKDNPGVAQTLNPSSIFDIRDLGAVGHDTYLNERIMMRARFERLSFIPVSLSEYELVDRKTAEVLARYKGVVTGYKKGLQAFKLWVGGLKCSDGYSRILSLMNYFKWPNKEVSK